MRLVIVTGMSGAGKTNALKMLEDMGFYCVDNLPIPLVEKFAELTLSNQGGIRNAALGIDIRSAMNCRHWTGSLMSGPEKGFHTRFCSWMPAARH